VASFPRPLTFKAYLSSISGFGLSFGTNSWVALEGYLGAFGEMAAIAGFFLLLSVPVSL
jgi:hypothetical protein